MSVLGIVPSTPTLVEYVATAMHAEIERQGEQVDLRLVAIVALRASEQWKVEQLG